MTQSIALRDLEEAAAHWDVFGGSGRDVVAAAAEALAAGADAPGLRELAGILGEPSYWEITPALERAAVELGLDLPAPGSPLAQARALRAESRRFVASNEEGRTYTRRVLGALGYLPDIVGARPLLELDYFYDMADAQVEAQPTHESVRALARWIAELDPALSARTSGENIPGAPDIEFDLTGPWTRPPRRWTKHQISRSGRSRLWGALILIPIAFAFVTAAIVALTLALD